MKRAITFLILLMSMSTSMAQEVPLIKVGEEELGVAKLDISVEVLGNIVTTTYDMHFYNPTNSVLEGELVFPLGENQSVSRFALDVFGKIREAVVVEKEQGRIAFEAVVRRRIDPALLEKGTGNNYRARIYPIPARGYKRVILAHEEELTYTEGKHFLHLPMSFSRELETFGLSVDFKDQKAIPRIKSQLVDGKIFQKTRNGYLYELVKRNYSPQGDFKVEVPMDAHLKAIAYDDFLYAYQTFTSSRVKKENPGSIALLWDESASMSGRDLEKELQFLDGYFGQLGTVEVDFVSFSNDIKETKKFSVQNGNWSALRTRLQSSVYDGGTSFDGVLQEATGAGETLLFSDVMNTLSELPSEVNNPLYVINSLRKANHGASNKLGQTNDGNYINLLQLSANEAVELINTYPVQFLGYESSNSAIELYPVAGSPVFNDFSISARGVRHEDKIKLNFGYKDQVSFSVDVDVSKAGYGTEQVGKVWAQAKINELQKDSEKNRAGIVSMGRQFNLVTDHTSLIVLERASDYAKYGIEPPADLLDEYLSILRRRGWTPPATVTETGVTEEETENADDSITEPASDETTTTAEATTSDLPSGMVTVSGTITDPSGVPLPGANVIVAGTSNGTQTDFDGNYSITAEVGDVIVYSYIGFDTLETDVTGSRNINIRMQENANLLNEVVVTAHGIKREAKAIGYAISSIESEDIEQRSEGDVARILTGKASGVDITSQSGLSGSATNVIIRGYNSINGSNQPLFVVDGVPFSSDTSAQGNFLNGNVGSSRFLDLDPNNIADVKVLKGLAAATLYGTAGRNGVIIITTKSNVDATSPSSGARFTPATPKNRFVLGNRARRVLIREKTLEEKQFNLVHMKTLQKATSAEEIYQLYLSQREEFGHMPLYYVDVYDYLKGYDEVLANRVLSNVAEIDNDNYEVLKVLAYKLEEQGNYPLAVHIYRRVLNLRSEDPQSYRDLALALQEVGKEKEAVNLLQAAYSNSFTEGTQRERTSGMKEIMGREITQLLKKISAGSDDESDSWTNVGSDIRVVVDWNHNDTEIDIEVIDPRFEKCDRINDMTQSSGKIVNHTTQGFGPEEFVQARADQGIYYVKANYRGGRYQKVDTPTFLKMTIYRNYGKKEQTKEVKVIRMARDERGHLIERIVING